MHNRLHKLKIDIIKGFFFFVDNFFPFQKSLLQQHENIIKSNNTKKQLHEY